MFRMNWSKMNAPYYFRTSSYLYTLDSAPSYFWYTGRLLDRQVFWGIANDWFVEITFADDGHLLEERHTQLKRSELLELVGPEAGETLLHRGTWGTQVELAPIKVLRFWIPAIRTGIEDLFETGKESIIEPESFSELELSDIEDSIQIWQERKQFIFWFDNEYYMSRGGKVEAS